MSAITEFLPVLQFLFAIGIIPLVNTLLKINKSLDDISTTIKLLEQDVNNKVRDLTKEVERLDSRLRKVEDHTIVCVQTLKNIKTGD